MRPLRIALAALAAAVAFAPATASAASRPFLYVVVIDGLDGDKVEGGGAPFISSLLAGDRARAAYYPGSRAVIPAATNPNHAAMMSGAYAERTGVVGNEYAIYAPLAHADSCARTGPLDFTALPTVTSGESRTCPLAEFTFEAIKRQAGPRPPTTAVIAGKPKLGRIFAGRNVNPRRTDADYLWAPCASGDEDDAYCDEDAPTNPVTGYAIDDATVMDEAIRTVTQGVRARGRMRRPRLTFVNLPQVDSAGHAFGTTGPYDVAISQADDQIERLVSTLRAQGIWNRSVLFILSDHSMDTAPGKVHMEGALDAAGIPDGSYLALDGENNSVMHLYLADRTARSRFDLLKRIRATATAVPGVAEALYRQPNPRDGGKAHTLERSRPGWHLGGPRVGDLFLAAKPGYTFIDFDYPINLIPGHHGAPQTQDNFLAAVSGGTAVRHRTIVPRPGRRATRPVNVDIAPTVMRLFGLRPPADNQGRVLRRAFRRVALR